MTVDQVCIAIIKLTAIGSVSLVCVGFAASVVAGLWRNR